MDIKESLQQNKQPDSEKLNVNSWGRHRCLNAVTLSRGGSRIFVSRVLTPEGAHNLLKIRVFL